MRPKYLPLVSLFLTLAAIAPAEDLRKVAEAHEREFATALKTKNASWFERIAAPDYYETNGSGAKMTRKEAMAQMKQMFGMGRVSTMTTKIVKVTPAGNGMTVLVDAHIVMKGTPPGAAKASTMDSRTRYEEAWSKDKGQWKIHHLKTITSKMMVDGKAVGNG